MIKEYTPNWDLPLADWQGAVHARQMINQIKGNTQSDINSPYIKENPLPMDEYKEAEEIQRKADKKQNTGKKNKKYILDLSLKELYHKFYNFYKSKGFNDNLISALAAIVKSESGWDYSAQNPEEVAAYGANVAGKGLFQWSNERNGGNVPDDFEEQLEYAYQEIINRKPLYQWIQNHPNASVQDYVNQLNRGFLWGSADSFATIASIEDGYNNAYRKHGYARRYNFKQDVYDKTQYANDYLNFIYANG